MHHPQAQRHRFVVAFAELQREGILALDELEPGLWLGQAWLETKKREILWLYFALARVDAGV